MSESEVRSMIKKFLLAVAVLIVGISPSRADLIYTDAFNYANGAPPSPWALTSGTGGQTISSNSLVITASGAGAGTGDYSRTFGGFGNISSGTVFAGYDLRITSAPTDSADNYFAHFVGQTSTTFINRAFLNLNSGSTNIALSKANAAAAVTFGSALALNTTYRIVQGFDFAGAGTSTLWINPITNADAATLTTSAGTSPTFLSAFSFRINNTSDGNKVIDNLTLATTFAEASGIVTAVPEPTSIALVGLAGVGGLVTRYRRRKIVETPVAV